MPLTTTTSTSFTVAPSVAGATGFTNQLGINLSRLGNIVLGPFVLDPIAPPPPPTTECVSWGGAPWGSFSWPGPNCVAAVLPSGATNPLYVVHPQGPGRLWHRIRGRGGQVDYPTLISGFEANEEVGLGFGSASGTIAARRVLDQPDLYHYGAEWTTYHEETGTIAWSGKLLTPAVHGSTAQLKGDGIGRRLERTVDRLLYQNRSYSPWQPRNTTGFGSGGDGYYVQGEENFSLDNDGALRWTISRSTVFANGDQTGFLFWAPNTASPRESKITRVAGTLRVSFTGPGYTLRIYRADGPSGGLSLQSTITMPSGGPLSKTFDISFGNPGDLINLEMYREGAVNDPGTAQALTMTITNLRVNGLADGDFFSTSDIARDIGGRLGFSLALVQESGINGLPLDVQQGSYAEALDRCMLLTDWRHRVIDNGFGPALDVGPWDTQTWTVLDEEFPRTLEPLPPYDEVVVPFRYSSGATGLLHVFADVLLDEGSSFGAITLDDPLPDSESAQALGERVVGYLRREDRLSGEITITQVADAQGQRQSAHLIHAGDTLVLRQGTRQIPLRIKGLRRTNSTVTLTFDDGMAQLDTLLERRRKRMQARGLID